MLAKFLKNSLSIESKQQIILALARIRQSKQNLRLYCSIIFKKDTLHGLMQRLSEAKGSSIDFNQANRKMVFRPDDGLPKWLERYDDLGDFDEKTPVIYGSPRHWIFRKSGPAWASRVGTMQVENVWCCSSGRVFSEEGRALVPLWNRRDSQAKHQLKNYLWGVSPPGSGMPNGRTISLDEVVMLAQSNDSIYGHFLIEVIPRLALAKKYLRPGKKIYVTTKFKQYTEALLAMGVDSCDIVSAWEHPLLYANSVEVPIFQLSGRFFYPEFGVRALRQLKQAMLSVGTHHAGRRIFISRQRQANIRGCEPPIKELLEKYGFVSVFPEELSFADQVSTFHGAEAVVGVHGSGMFNTVFCRPGTKVFDLFPASINNLIFSLSRAFDFDYIAVKTNVGNPLKWSMRNNFEVDLSALERALRHEL